MIESSMAGSLVGSEENGCVTIHFLFFSRVFRCVGEGNAVFAPWP